MHLMALGAFWLKGTPMYRNHIPHGLNAPYGAWCFLTVKRAWRGRKTDQVLMHLMALGAF